MSAFDLGDLLSGGGGSSDPVQVTPQWLLDIQKQLGGVVSSGLKGYTPGSPYTGNLNFAGSPTTQEQSSLDQLTKLLGQPGTGSLFDQASGQISDTLAGKYADPNQSPYIQAMTKIAQNQLNDQITQERGQRGARGTYYTTAGVNAEDLLRGRTLDNLQGVIGNFAQNERQNQLGAASTAQQLDQYKNMTVPLQKIAAGQTYGSLTRTIQQANLESQYQDYLRQRTEQGNNVNTATSLAINQPNITPGFVNPPSQPSGLSSLLGLAGSLGPLFANGGALSGLGGGLAGLLGGGAAAAGTTAGVAAGASAAGLGAGLGGIASLAPLLL